MNKARFSLAFLLSFLWSSVIHAQADKELRHNFTSDGSRYVRVTFLNQVWLRFNESNSGTLVMGEPAQQTIDIGLRRTRIQFYGQLTDHVFFYTQFGQNNFNFLAQYDGNRKLQAFFHDALAEYKCWKTGNLLILGGGLTIVNGLSRFSQPSIGTILTMDVPLFAQATVDQTDEFSRKLSAYARGQIGRLNYRLAMSDPFPINTNGQPLAPISRYAVFAQYGHHKQYQSFFMFNFLDMEPMTTPYMAGTYLGKKKVLNLEGGFIHQDKATWTEIDHDTLFHALNLWSIAAFYDAPLHGANGSAISMYAGYFNYNYGPGYLRYNGVMNPANGITGVHPPGSQGNAYPMFGTGQIFYGQIGYLFPANFLGEEHGQLQSYIALTSAAYNRLNSQMNVLNAGFNWLIDEHRSKLTIDYQMRPQYEDGIEKLSRNTIRSQVTLQYQVFF